MRGYSEEILDNAKGLRQRMTDAERTLWHFLRGPKPDGYRFRRQQPIASYIVDFYRPKARLILELDGKQHLDGHQRDQDEIRDAFLKERGYRVLRFTNAEVLEDLPNVLARIRERLSS